ncbi:Exc2 family lipoprotein [Hafnia paralvei]|uniref:Exc2 family lipoprotein n=1 Tax=Hafnia paralvei TaxID=546367 RepID=UPI001CCE4995|nr:Exc2 family lipoprotein [Hafnia paralvei]UBM43334.1 Exc2 family lipoprotein [Hafnia paralvei]
MLVLGGCTSTLSSPERHAKHFVYASNSDSDPNFRTRMQESVRTSVPFFDQIYQLGQKDNAAGINHDQAKKRAEYFYGNEFLDGIQRKEDFAGKSYSQLRGLTLSGTKTHVKQRFLPLTPLLMVSDVLWSPVLPA